MDLHFYKYQGTGNDFIILDNREGIFDSLSTRQVEKLCDRRFGIGADGLMLLNLHPDFDFEMKYFNADGKHASMCGNGGRCLTKFASDMGLVQTTYRFIAVDGEHEAHINLDGTVALKMNDVNTVEEEAGHFILDTGSPHYVSFENDVMHLDVFNKGRDIRNSPPFRESDIRGIVPSLIARHDG